MALGSVTPLDVEDFDGQPLYFTLAVGSSAELPVRMELNSAPYALRAHTADALAPGAALAVDSLCVGGTTIVDSSGMISAAQIDGITLASLTCSTGEIVEYSSSGWACAAQEHSADDITTGVLAMDRLPEGIGEDNIAYGSHTHTAADLGALPDSTVATDIGGLASTTVATDIGGLASTTIATDIGGLASTTTALDLAATPQSGATKATAAEDCNALHTEFPDLHSGIYWIDPKGSGAFKGYCDMDTDGGGWTLCLNTRYEAAAAAMFTDTYSQIPVQNNDATGYYDWCENNESEYLFTLADHGAGRYSPHTLTVRLENPSPFDRAGEWTEIGVTASPQDVTVINSHPTLNTACTGGWTLLFWQYVNPAQRGLRGFKRGHLQCQISGGSPGTDLYAGSGCNYGSCTSPPSWESDVHPTWSQWTWRLTATAGNGNNSWKNGYPIQGDRSQVYFR